MKWTRVLLLGISVVGVFFSGTVKKKKFLDYFNTFKGDSLVFDSPDHIKIFTTDVPWELKGTAIDTSLSHVYSKEEADDLQYYVKDNGENSTFGYYKVKLDLGYYLVIIRAGGEYWNSRVYACLYHSGENKITHTVLIGENFGDAGDSFSCNSVLRKKDKQWTIAVHEHFSEPVDPDKFHKGENYSMEIRNTDILYQIENVDDRYVFVEKERKDQTQVTK
jgi:hypothetical protein